MEFWVHAMLPSGFKNWKKDPFIIIWAVQQASQVIQWVKNPSAMQEMQETWLWSLDQEDPLEEGMATHSSILAWRISWTKDPGVLQSIELQRLGHNWSNWACTSNTAAAPPEPGKIASTNCSTCHYILSLETVLIHILKQSTL